MLKLLLTGATGFIGTNFVLKLHSKYQITALVRPQSNTRVISPFCSLFTYNGNIEELINFCKRESFDGVVHLATSWFSHHSPNQIGGLINDNITFGTQLLEATKQAKIPFFINTSTFGSYCNSIVYRPSSLYAATKTAFEKILDYYALTSETIFSHILIYNTYGPHDNQYRLFNLLKNALDKNEELKMSDGHQLMDITHIDDIINGFHILIKKITKDPIQCKNQIFALKNPQRQTLREVIQIFEKVSNQTLRIAWGARERRELEIDIPWEGGKKLENWKPQITLRRGIQNFIEKRK